MTSQFLTIALIYAEQLVCLVNECFRLAGPSQSESPSTGGCKSPLTTDLDMTL